MDNQFEGTGGITMSDTTMLPQTEFEVVNTDRSVAEVGVVEQGDHEVDTSRQILDIPEFNEDMLISLVQERGIDGTLRYFAGEDEKTQTAVQEDKDPQEMVEEINYPDDPEFREHMLSIVSQKLQNGEQINMDEILKEAQMRYENGDMAEKLPLEQKLVAFDQMVQDLVSERVQLLNSTQELKNMLDTKEQQVQMLAEALLLILKKKKEEEKNKKQKSWLELLILLVGSLMQEVVETGATQDKNKTQKEQVVVADPEPQFLIK